MRFSRRAGPLVPAMYLVDLLFGDQVAKGVGGGPLIDRPAPAELRYPFISDPAMARQAD